MQNNNFLKTALIVGFFLVAPITALAFDLQEALSDANLTRALEEDGITIVKVEKVLTDVNISNKKRNYTIILAKAKMAYDVERFRGGEELKNAYDFWGGYGFCFYRPLEALVDKLHILVIIFDDKYKIDAILYEIRSIVGLSTKVDLMQDNIRNYPDFYNNNTKDRAVFVVTSQGCGERSFYLGDERYAIILKEFPGED
jgi:hypothetical protein